MDINKAVTIELGRINQPVITLYQIAVIIFKLYKYRTYAGEKLAHIRKTRATRSDCTRIVTELNRRGILDKSAVARHSEVFSVLTRDRESVEAVACSVDPFAYISHMTAMDWHGLTDRIGRTLFYSSPPPKKWRQFAWERMRKDIGEDDVQDYLQQNLPRLRRLNLDKIGRYAVHRHLSEHLGAFTSIRDSNIRVSTIGRTFLDMIREPDLCGGIYHVLDVYQEHGPRFMDLIVDEVDRHGTKIDKVRAGYILDERLGLDAPRVSAWTRFAQRGGSRKLYAHNDYSPAHSEKWCLSINIGE